MHIIAHLCGLFQHLHFLEHLFPAFRPADGFLPVKGAQLFNDGLLMFDFLLLVHPGFDLRLPDHGPLFTVVVVVAEALLQLSALGVLLVHLGALFVVRREGGHLKVPRPVDGGDVLLVALVDVQVVGGQVRHHGDAGALRHGHQLEGAQLQHREIVGGDVRRVAQQGPADIAPQVDGLPGGLQQLGDDGGGRRLAVGAGDGDQRAGADVKKDLHLAGEDAAPLHGGGELRHVGPEAGGAEDYVLRQVRQIVLPQLQPAAVGGQLRPQVSQVRLFVPAGDGDPPIQQQADQGPVADADADDGHGLAPQGVQICFKVHGYAPYAADGGRECQTGRLYRGFGKITTDGRRLSGFFHLGPGR